MAKKRRKAQKIPRGARGLSIPYGKCRVIEGATTVCVSNSGKISIRRGPTMRAERRKKCVMVGAGKTRRKVCPSKYSPTSKQARKLPKGPVARGRRLQACRSNLFTNASTGNCSCVLVNRQGRLQATPIGQGACIRGAKKMSAVDAVKALRAGNLRRPKEGFDIMTPTGKVQRFRTTA